MDASPREPTRGKDRSLWKARPHLASPRSLLTASLATGDPEFIYRVTLIGVFLTPTTPVSAHLMQPELPFKRERRWKTPEAVDEPGHELNKDAGSER
jgi:hypothetical protein